MLFFIFSSNIFCLQNNLYQLWLEFTSIELVYLYSSFTTKIFAFTKFYHINQQKYLNTYSVVFPGCHFYWCMFSQQFWECCFSRVLFLYRLISLNISWTREYGVLMYPLTHKTKKEARRMFVALLPLKAIQ